MKAESWGMLLLVSAWPKDTPGNPRYKGMPGLQIGSFHPALDGETALTGSERALQSFAGRALQPLSNNYVKPQITSFLPFLVVFCSNFPGERECPVVLWMFSGRDGNLYLCESAWSVL